MARFFSAEWANAYREVINAGPPAEYRSTKLDEYWDWIDMVRGLLGGQLALRATGGPDGADEYLRLSFEGGACTDAAPVSAEEANEATFLIEGDLDTWRSLYDGYDVGKAIMYRKLLLTRGEILDFFKAIYLFVEVLVSATRVPTEFATPAPVA